MFVLENGLYRPALHAIAPLLVLRIECRLIESVQQHRIVVLQFGDELPQYGLLFFRGVLMRLKQIQEHFLPIMTMLREPLQEPLE